MTAKSSDFKETMTKELNDFIQSQARALSPADLEQLGVDLPGLRELIARIPSHTYPSLPNQLEFLSLIVEDYLHGPKVGPAEQMAAESAFALLYFQRATDLIPDLIPGMGLLDDAVVVSTVLRRHEYAFKHSSHADKLRWPVPNIDVDHLLAVISPLRLRSFYWSMATQPRSSAPG